MARQSVLVTHSFGGSKSGFCNDVMWIIGRVAAGLCSLLSKKVYKSCLGHDDTKPYEYLWGDEIWN